VSGDFEPVKKSKRRVVVEGLFVAVRQKWYLFSTSQARADRAGRKPPVTSDQRPALDRRHATRAGVLEDGRVIETEEGFQTKAAAPRPRLRLGRGFNCSGVLRP
jgi:hypothetical protein